MTTKRFAGALVLDKTFSVERMVEGNEPDDVSRRVPLVKLLLGLADEIALGNLDVTQAFVRIVESERPATNPFMVGVTSVTASAEIYVPEER